MRVLQYTRDELLSFNTRLFPSLDVGQREYIRTLFGGSRRGAVVVGLANMYAEVIHCRM